jgi:NTE family protein
VANESGRVGVDTARAVREREMTMAKKKADAVFEGGGVKGIGLVGAYSVFEGREYEFVNLAGTSAGAIVAGLLAVGYSAEELKRVMQALDYRKFKDEGFLDRLGVLGKGLSIGFEYGIYEGKYFETWFEGLLQAKGITTFGPLRNAGAERCPYRLQVVASDVSAQRLLVLPQDLKSFGYDPNSFSIARAVRMSMSIPVFFEPAKLQDSSGGTHYVVDGGVLSNYPIWLLDDGTKPLARPVFGFKLVEPGEREASRGEPAAIRSVKDYLGALAGTMMNAHDNFHISRTRGEWQRTVGIKTVVDEGGKPRYIKATDFDLTADQGEKLFQNGVAAATEFLDQWNFSGWKSAYRKSGG